MWKLLGGFYFNSLMKKINYLVLLFLFSCGGMDECRKSVSIPDLNKNFAEFLDFSSCGDQIVYYELRIEGEFSGKFLINSHFVQSNGSIDTVFRGDHYGNQFPLEYLPYGEIIGDLEIEVILI